MVVLCDDVCRDVVLLCLCKLVREVSPLHPVVLVDHVEEPHSVIVIDSSVGLRPEEQVVENLWRSHVDGVKTCDRTSEGLVHLHDLSAGLELDELVGDRIGCLSSEDLGYEPLSGIVGSSGRRMVLSEWFRGCSEDHPLGRPLEPPFELSLHLPNVDLSVGTALTAVLEVRELIGVEVCFAEASAIWAERIVRREIGICILPGDLMDDLDDLGPLGYCHVDPLGELPFGIELMGPYDLAVDLQGIDRVQERLDEVMGIVVMLAARTGDHADRHTDILLVLLGEELIPLPEGIERIDQVDEPDILSLGCDCAADRFSCDRFSETSDMYDSGRTDTCCDQRVLACICYFLCDYICPMHSIDSPHICIIKMGFGPARTSQYGLPVG